MTSPSKSLERKLEFTIVIEQSKDKGWIAQVKELPCLMVYSESRTHLMEKLFTCIAGYTLAFPHGDVPVELVQ